jgi:hypothetical protein
MLGHYQGDLKDLNEVDVLQPNDAITLQMWCEVKILLMDYHEGLNDLNKVYVFSSNYHVPTLWRRGWIKIKLVDDEGALNDLNALQSKYMITLQRWGEIKKVLGDY